MGVDLFAVTTRAWQTLSKAEEDQSAACRALRERERKVDRFKNRLPWFAVVMTLLLLRFRHVRAICTAIGAEWARTTTGGEACVFYAGEV